MAQTINNPFSEQYFQDGTAFDGYKKQLKEQGMETDFYNEFGKGFTPGSPEHRRNPMQNRYLTFTAKNDGCGVGFYNGGITSLDCTLEYSINNGTTWNEYVIASNLETVNVITLNNEETIMFRGINDRLSFGSNKFKAVLRAYIDGSVSASGDVTSLLNGVGGDCTIPSDCYQYMFSGCTGLTTAPALPATTLAAYCYQYMFDNCENLGSITCFATDISARGCTTNWVRGVSETGTFIKASSMTDWTRGVSGIPEGWMVVDA